MISPHLRFEGYDARSWTNLLSLFAPGLRERIDGAPPDSDAPELGGGDAAAGDPTSSDARAALGARAPGTLPTATPLEPGGSGARAAAGTLVIVRADDGRVLKAIHTLRGRVRDLEYQGPQDLERVAGLYGARRAVEIREGAPEELAEHLAQRLVRGDDYVTQWLVLARIVRELTEAGKVHSWPRPLADVPVPTAGMVRRALDVVLPDDHVAVVVLWEGGHVWTAAVLRRRGGDVDLCAGPDLLLRWTGPLGGDWRRDLRFITDAVARTVGPVHFGLFAEAADVRALLRDPDPGAWAKAVALRDVVVYPTPPYVAVALGADAARAVARTTSRWLGGFDALRPLAPLAQYVRGRVTEVTSVTATLGFDPLRALARALADRPVRDDGVTSDRADSSSSTSR
jgi:hypothetical protein